VRQLISRVVNTIVALGQEGGYFANEASRDAFRDELTHLLVEQKMAFNSPVWFNVGVQPKPQCSACFINSVQDNMESIMGLTRTEGMRFKWGSGTGTNFSSLRGSKETLSGGGNRVRAGKLHERLRRLCGRDQERRQDAARGQDGDPQYRSSGHRGIHRMQTKEERKAQVLIENGYDSGIRRRRIQLDFLPEREPLGARDGRVHARVREDKDWWTRTSRMGSPRGKNARSRL